MFEFIVVQLRRIGWPSPSSFAETCLSLTPDPKPSIGGRHHNPSSLGPEKFRGANALNVLRGTKGQPLEVRWFGDKKEHLLIMSQLVGKKPQVLRYSRKDLMSMRHQDGLLPLPSNLPCLAPRCKSPMVSGGQEKKSKRQPPSQPRQPPPPKTASPKKDRWPHAGLLPAPLRYTTGLSLTAQPTPLQGRQERHTNTKGLPFTTDDLSWMIGDGILGDDAPVFSIFFQPATEDFAPDALHPDAGVSPTILKARMKQISFGKATVGYRNYCNRVPRDKRGASDPQTPNPNQRCSKRAFDGKLRLWRRALHRYDDGNTWWERCSSPPSEEPTLAWANRSRADQSRLAVYVQCAS